MRTLKATGVTWCPAIPVEWKMDRVKNHFFISKDLSKETNPVVLRLARSGITIRDISTNEGQMAESYENYNIVQPGDLLLNPMDLISGSNCNMSELSGVISPAYTNLRAKTHINPKYFDYYFKTQYWIMAMFVHGKGVSFDNRWTINAESIKNYEVPMPSWEEQNRIVEQIGVITAKIDALIANQERQIEKLKQYKQALITEVVTKGLDPTVPMKDSGVEWIGEIPETWETKPLKYLFSFGKGLPITKADLVENGVKVVSYGQIHAKYNLTAHLDEKLFRFVPKSICEANPFSLVNKGDFIFADTSEDIEGSGDFVYIDQIDRIFAGYHTITLFSKTKKSNQFLAYLFMSEMWKKQIWSKVCGVKVFSLSRSILSRTSVLLPPVEEQDRICSFLDEKSRAFEREIAIKQSKIEKLNQYKKSLIYEYVTGKKEVKTYA